MNNQPVHFAFPVHDFEAARDFYVNVIGCKTGREADHWIDFDLYGHQVVALQSEHGQRHRNEYHQHPAEELATVPAAYPIKQLDPLFSVSIANHAKSRQRGHSPIRCVSGELSMPHTRLKFLAQDLTPVRSGGGQSVWAASLLAST